jgi:hypothetical protein
MKISLQMIEPKRIALDENKMNIKLYKYYIDKTAKNPFYPVTRENLHKMLTSVITIKGLKLFYRLRRRFIKDDSNLSRIELANLCGLWFYHATTNRNLHELLEWDDYVSRVGIDMDFRTVKPILRKNGYIIVNKGYDPKQMKHHRIWKETLLREIYFKDYIMKFI